MLQVLRCLKTKELMSKFKVSTPKDLVRAILLSGEIAKIYGEMYYQ